MFVLLRVDKQYQFSIDVIQFAIDAHDLRQEAWTALCSAIRVQFIFKFTVDAVIRAVLYLAGALFVEGRRTSCAGTNGKPRSHRLLNYFTR